MMKQYAPALKHIADIIEKGIKEHPGMLETYIVTCFFNMIIEKHNYYKNLL